MCPINTLEKKVCRSSSRMAKWPFSYTGCISVYCLIFFVKFLKMSATSTGFNLKKIVFRFCFYFLLIIYCVWTKVVLHSIATLEKNDRQYQQACLKKSLSESLYMVWNLTFFSKIFKILASSRAFNIFIYPLTQCE